MRCDLVLESQDIASAEVRGCDGATGTGERRVKECEGCMRVSEAVVDMGGFNECAIGGVNSVVRGKGGEVELVGGDTDYGAVLAVEVG